MTARLQIPSVLAFTVVGAVSTAIAITACGDDPPPVADASCTYCIYETIDNGNCPPPTCATGDNQDICPPGCVPAPIG